MRDHDDAAMIITFGCPAVACASHRADGSVAPDVQGVKAIMDITVVISQKLLRNGSRFLKIAKPKLCYSYGTPAMLKYMYVDDKRENKRLKKP